MKKSAPKESLDGFLFYIKQDTARSLGEIPGKPKEHLELEDVGIGYFHALYEVTLIYFKLGQYDNMLVYLRKLLHFLPQVTRNERQKAIENVLRAMSSSSAGNTATDLPEKQRVLVDTYRLTLEVLESLNIDARLTFTTKKSLGHIYLQMNDRQHVEMIVSELHLACKDPKTGLDDLRNRAEWLLEMTALELQLCALTKGTTWCSFCDDTCLDSYVSFSFFFFFSFRFFPLPRQKKTNQSTSTNKIIVTCNCRSNNDGDYPRRLWENVNG